jgi:hypothetical protein
MNVNVKLVFLSALVWSFKASDSTVPALPLLICPVEVVTDPNFADVVAADANIDPTTEE